MRVHSRTLLSLSQPGRRAYVAYQLRRALSRSGERADAGADPVLIYRGNVQDATMIGIRRYRPQYLGGRVSLFLPNRGWLRSATAVRRWRPLANVVEEYIGPDGCPAEEMLLEPHVGAIAELFRRCRDENPGVREGPQPRGVSAASCS